MLAAFAAAMSGAGAGAGLRRRRQDRRSHRHERSGIDADRPGSVTAAQMAVDDFGGTVLASRSA